MLLSAKQKETLGRVASPVSPAMQRAGYPGWPGSYLDGRSIEALERRGLVTNQLHRLKSATLICYVLTEAGREALARL